MEFHRFVGASDSGAEVSEGGYNRAMSDRRKGVIGGTAALLRRIAADPDARMAGLAAALIWSPAAVVCLGISLGLLGNRIPAIDSDVAFRGLALLFVAACLACVVGMGLVLVLLWRAVRRPASKG
jgi:hypothetical protein